MLKKLLQTLRLAPRPAHARRDSARVLGPQQHGLRKAHISKNAVSVVEGLQGAGFQAYVVGGCIRDLLLNLAPKDYDVATNATPEQVRATFRNARIIGRRFKLVHVRYGREIIEVATFRSHQPVDEDEDHGNLTLDEENGRILRDNIYGSQEDDAQRRDFTINALYFDPSNEHILDHAHGISDLRNRLVRLIGTPQQRYQEDPVRMLRAVRFAAKLDFSIEHHSAEPIPRLAGLLRNVPAARLFDEVLKLFLSGQGLATFDLLRQYQLFAPLFPLSDRALDGASASAEKLIRQALANTDERIRLGKPVTPAFLFAALLWPTLPRRALQLREEGLAPFAAWQRAAIEVIAEQCASTAIPKRFSIPMREIWDLQERLGQRRRADLTLEHPRFRAAYDFLLLREMAGEQTGGLGDWWTAYQSADPTTRGAMLRQLSGGKGKPARRRRRRRSAASNGEQGQD